MSFSIATEKMTSHVPTKTRLLAQVVPGDKRTYIFNDEPSYYRGYQDSWFALTKKKSGWDCLRHYEILANGCIPVFEGLEHCPANTLTTLPKTLLHQGRALYERLSAKSVAELTKAECNECELLSHQLLLHTRSTLSTEHAARYLLGRLRGEKRRVLFLCKETRPDYLRCLTLHGLKSVLGVDCHDYPKIGHIYKSERSWAHLYGNGFTYTNLLDPSLHDSTRDRRVRADIEAHRYDKVIYGSYHRGMPLLGLVRQHYAPEDIVLVCGEDLNCHRRGCSVEDHKNWVERGHHVFVRELP